MLDPPYTTIRDAIYNDGADGTRFAIRDAIRARNRRAALLCLQKLNRPPYVLLVRTLSFAPRHGLGSRGESSGRHFHLLENRPSSENKLYI